MAQFLISYDTHGTPRNYQAVYQLMATWKAVRLTESLWMANLLGPANVVRDFVSRALDKNDGVAVVELKQGSDWATVNVTPAASTWLSAYVRPAQKAA